MHAECCHLWRPHHPPSRASSRFRSWHEIWATTCRSESLHFNSANGRSAIGLPVARLILEWHFEVFETCRWPTYLRSRGCECTLRLRGNWANPPLRSYSSTLQCLRLQLASISSSRKRHNMQWTDDTCTGLVSDGSRQTLAENILLSIQSSRRQRSTGRNCSRIVGVQWLIEKV
jgi:hypothetical protein